MTQSQLARQIFEAVDGQEDDAGGLLVAHHLVGAYLTEVEAVGRAGGLDACDIEAEIAIGLRRLRDTLQAGQQARNGSAAATIEEILVRIGALLRGLARRAMAQRPGPFARQHAATAGSPALWLQADRPMRARVWSALGEIHRVRRARAAGGQAYTLLPDTLRPALVEAWLVHHDLLSDAWAEANVAKTSLVAPSEFAGFSGTCGPSGPEDVANSSLMMAGSSSPDEPASTV